MHEIMEEAAETAGIPQAMRPDIIACVRDAVRVDAAAMAAERLHDELMRRKSPALLAQLGASR